MQLNKQIETLAKQAGMVMYPTGLGNVHENTIWGDRNIEAFAILIINHCAAHIERVALRTESSDGISWACDEIIKNISKDFGV